MKENKVKRLEKYNKYEAINESIRLNKMSDKGLHIKKIGKFIREYQYIEGTEKNDDDESKYEYWVIAKKKKGQEDTLKKLQEYGYEEILNNKNKMYFKRLKSDINSKYEDELNEVKYKEKRQDYNNRIKIAFLKILVVCLSLFLLNTVVVTFYEQYGLTVFNNKCIGNYFLKINITDDNKIYLYRNFEYILNLINVIKLLLTALVGISVLEIIGLFTDIDLLENALFCAYWIKIVYVVVAIILFLFAGFKEPNERYYSIIGDKLNMKEDELNIKLIKDSSFKEYEKDNSCNVKVIFDFKDEYEHMSDSDSFFKDDIFYIEILDDKGNVLEKNYYMEDGKKHESSWCSYKLNETNESNIKITLNKEKKEYVDMDTVKIMRWYN